MDGAPLSALHRKCFADGWEDASLDDILAMPGVIGWIVCMASEGEMPVAAGFMLCRHVADEAEVLSIGVLPAWRSQGLGGALLEKAITTLRSLQVRRLFLEVSVFNAAAIALYRKCGFYDVGRRPHYYDSKTDALVLLYEIT